MLEPRLLMAAHTWLGAAPAGLNQLWSYGPNWTSGVAPGTNETGVTLVFPVNGVQKILTDDIPSLAHVDAITFTGSGYIIGGNNSTIHLDAIAFDNIDDQVGGNILGDSGLNIALVPGDYVRVQAGRLNINAKLIND